MLVVEVVWDAVVKMDDDAVADSAVLYYGDVAICITTVCVALIDIIIVFIGADSSLPG